MAICRNVYCSSPGNPAKIAMPDSYPSSPHICIVLLLISFVSNLISKRAKCNLTNCELTAFLLSNQKNISRFQALTALSVQNLAPFGCFHESVRILEPCQSKS